MRWQLQRRINYSNELQILRCNCHQPLLIPQLFKLSHWQQKNMMIDQGRASCLRLRPGLSSLHIVDLWLQRVWGKPWWARRPCASLQKYKKCVCVFVLHYKFNESISTPNISRELVVFSLFSHFTNSLALRRRPAIVIFALVIFLSKIN